MVVKFEEQLRTVGLKPGYLSTMMRPPSGLARPLPCEMFRCDNQHNFKPALIISLSTLQLLSIISRGKLLDTDS